MTNIRKIKINISTYVFILLFFYSGFKKELFSILTVFIIHEFGHIFFCYLFKTKIISINVFPYGGIIKLKKLLNSPSYVDFFIASGGLLFQVILEALNIFFIKNDILSYYNRSFALINLLPIIPFDGYKIFNALLTRIIPYFYSLVISIVISVLGFGIVLSYQIIYSRFNLIFFIFVFIHIFYEIKDFVFVINQFYLERLLYNFNFRKTKYYRSLNIKLLMKGVHCFFFNKVYISERTLLAKKFDNSSYFW